MKNHKSIVALCKTKNVLSTSSQSIISPRVIPMRDPGKKIALEEGEVGYC